MKKIFLSIIFLTIISTASAQEKRINLYGGYVFEDAIDVFNDYNQYVNATVKGGVQYGGSIEFFTPYEMGVELMYLGQSTTMPLSLNSNYLTGARNGVYDVNLNYGLVSLNKYSRNGMMEGYGGLMLGCLFSNATNSGNLDSLGNRYQSVNTSSTHFTWGLKLGANMWVSNSVAIKLQAQFLSTSEAFGGGSYYGYYGYYYDYYSYINLFQWNFSSGLVFSFGGE